MRFDAPGTFIVVLTVTNNQNLVNPTPVTRIVTVKAPASPVSSGAGGGAGSVNPFAFGLFVFVVAGVSSSVRRRSQTSVRSVTN